MVLMDLIYEYKNVEYYSFKSYIFTNSFLYLYKNVLRIARDRWQFSVYFGGYYLLIIPRCIF